MSSQARGHSRLIPLIALLGVTLVLAACGASGAAILSTVGSSIDGGNGQAARPAPANGSTGDGSPGSGPTTGGSGDKQLYDPQEANLLIIKTGTMDLQVGGLDPALAGASQKISALGGYVSGSQRSGDNDKASATVTYRIPAARWDEALVALRALGVKVLAEETQTQDVTGQVVDLSARITNLQATERALQAIMLKADKISDVLAVQQQLTDVRGQIEQLTAERKHLQEQAAFSTLTVNYSLKEQAVITTTNKFDPGSEVDRASASLVDVLQGVATAGIWFGIVWLPILIVLGVVAAVVAFVLRRTLRYRYSEPTIGPGSGPGATPAPASEA
jgi:hypothetical protein